MTTFENRDPVTSAFWTERFEHDFLPWDRGGVPLALQQFVASAERPYVTLIPGCGTGHEAKYLYDAGWDVTAIDFSPAAVAVARVAMGAGAACVHEADFFTYEPIRPIELIYERAFLCALPPSKWPLVVQRWAQLLSAGGLLAGFFYRDELQKKGPPFGIAQLQLEGMLAPFFAKIAESAVTDSIEIFKGKEIWQVWRRLA